MASSNYYYNKYKQKRTEVTTLENQIRELQKILGNLTDNLYDEIGAVNNEIDDLKSDLNKAVRHNSSFSNNANSLESKKERTVTSDGQLNTTVSELQEEITRVSNKRNQSVSDRDYYYNKYVAKKEEEKQALLGNN